jgi:hypothetical protein
MATRKRAKADKEPEENPEGQAELEEGEAVQVHDAYLEHRLGGGRAAEPAAYERGIEQFEKLPGALRTTPPTGGSSHEDERPGDDKGEGTEA